jgi:hypothetical protein
VRGTLEAGMLVRMFHTEARSFVGISTKRSSHGVVDTTDSPLRLFTKPGEKRKREHREWSTVVKIFIPPPSFKPISLSFSRFIYSKTPKQVFFNPKK